MWFILSSTLMLPGTHLQISKYSPPIKKKNNNNKNSWHWKKSLCARWPLCTSVWRHHFKITPEDWVRISKPLVEKQRGSWHKHTETSRTRINYTELNKLLQYYWCFNVLLPGWSNPSLSSLKFSLTVNSNLSYLFSFLSPQFQSSYWI